MSSRSRKKDKPIKKNALITNQPPRRQLKSAMVVITVDEFIKKSREVHGNQYDYSRLGESAVDFIEIRGDAIGEADYNPINNTNTIVFSKPVLTLKGDGKDEDSDNGPGRTGSSSQDNHKLEPHYSDKALDQMITGFEESVNLITTTLNKLKKLAAEHLDAEITIQELKGNKEYAANLKTIKKDSEEWCIHFLADYFVHIHDVKDSLLDE